MKVNGPSKEQVRARAFEIYRKRGGGPGHELDDWLQAEFELTHLPSHVLTLKPMRPARWFLRRQRSRFPVRFPKH